MTLMKRNKRQRLSFDEKSFIYRTIEYEKNRLCDEARRFGLSIGTISNVIKSFESYRTHLFSETGRISRKIRELKKVSHLIENYWDMTSHPFTWKDISRHLMKELRIRIKEGVVTKILKESLNMSYKKGKSRSVDFGKIDRIY